MAFSVSPHTAQGKRSRSARRSKELQHNNGMHPTGIAWMSSQDWMLSQCFRRVMPAFGCALNQGNLNGDNQGVPLSPRLHDHAGKVVCKSGGVINLSLGVSS
jgi:hypothetical protein